MHESALYDRDFHLWTIANAQALRQHRFGELDLENLAEELESMGASERRELLSRLDVLLMHLLKWQYQPALRGKSWRLTIIHQRTAIGRLLEQSPSLRRFIDTATLEDVYGKAVRAAVIETDLERAVFPGTCPYSVEEILGDDYLPD